MKLEVPSQIHDPDQNVALNELRSEIEQRFSSLDLHDRITRDPSRVIGFGNYGLVCEGSLLSEPNSRVAVKVVRYGDKGALPVLKRVLAEVYVWSKLKHEHIHELLAHVIQILGIANGLNYLHNYEHGCNSIVHGDVKGPNVLISNDGRALLTDFGFSHLAKASFSLAKEEHAGGTLDWMPPEYLDSDQFSMTVEGDVWAYGMTILELFTRRRPFHYLNHKVAILKHILMNDRKRPSDEDTNCRMTDEWWEICQSCWNRKPSLRPSMSTVIQEISRLQVCTYSDYMEFCVEMLTLFTRPRPESQPLRFHQSTSTNTNVKSVPGEVVELPSVSGTNLYGRVDKDLTAHPVHGAFMVVYRGTLRPEGTKVAIKTARGGLCGNEQVTKVGHLVTIPSPF
ncbi:hypothetical protein ID866_3572 [Astraeus odoratus]|nr:hypothetical protein ID866_3572 [Astraeus odoratus]